MSPLLSILDPFSGPATFALKKTAIIPPQQAVLREPSSPASPRPSPPLIEKAQWSARTDAPGALAGAPRAGPPREDGVQGTAVARSSPSARDSGVAAGRARVGTGQGRKIPCHSH